MYGSALCDMFLANKYLQYVAALKITSAARGRLGRRIARTERALVIIKSSHPLLIRHSLKSTLRGPKVFWYKRKIELDMLFRNYLELVKKTGFMPPRKLVEDNIIEIARRVLERKNQLIVLVQRRWRGFMARRIVRYFRTEISRLFQFRVSRAMKIQRVYRGHAVRLLVPSLIAGWERQAVMDDYLAASKDAHTDASKFKVSDQVMGYYRVERGEEKTSRFTSRVAASEHFDHKKMHAFWDSPYADEKLGKQTDRLLDIEYGLIQREKDEVQRQHDRREFMEHRVHERGPLGYGLRAIATVFSPSIYYYDQVVPPHDLGEVEKASTGINMSSGLLANVAAGAEVLTSVLCSRSKKFHLYFKTELSQLTELLMERMKHDFNRSGLDVRFKAHNEDRLRRLKIRHRIEDRAEKQRLAALNAGEKNESPLKARSRRAISSASLDTTSTTLKDKEGSAPGGHLRAPGLGASVPVTLPVIKGATGALESKSSKNKPKPKDGKHLRGNFKYPEHIYFNAMEWLYEDYDV